MPAKKSPKKNGKNGTKVTVTVQMAKKKKSAAEMRKDKAEDKREMMIQKQTLRVLNKIASSKKK